MTMSHIILNIGVYQYHAINFTLHIFTIILKVLFGTAAVSVKNAGDDKKNSKPCIMRIYFSRVKILSAKSLSCMNIFFEEKNATGDFTLLCECIFHSFSFFTDA